MAVDMDLHHQQLQQHNGLHQQPQLAHVQVSQPWTGELLYSVFSQLPLEEKDHFLQLVFETDEFHLLVKIAADSNKMTYELIGSNPTVIEDQNTQENHYFQHETMQLAEHQEQQQQHQFVEHQPQYDGSQEINMNIEGAEIPEDQMSPLRSGARSRKMKKGARQSCSPATHDPTSAIIMDDNFIISLIDSNQTQHEQHNIPQILHPPHDSQGELGAQEIEVNDSANNSSTLTNWGKKKRKRPLKKYPIDR